MGSREFLGVFGGIWDFAFVSAFFASLPDPLGGYWLDLFDKLYFCLISFVIFLKRISRITAIYIR